MEEDSHDGGQLGWRTGGQLGWRTVMVEDS